MWSWPVMVRAERGDVREAGLGAGMAAAWTVWDLSGLVFCATEDC